MSRRTALRVAATLTTMALVYGPAGLPATADQAGSTTTTTAQAGPDFWQPPVLSDGDVANLVGQLNPTPVPLAGFSQQIGCVTSSNSTVALTAIPPAQQMLNLQAAQRFSTGAGVKVAVIDTGVNPHPFLQGRLQPGGDFVGNNDGNGAKDCDGHGTLTAGIVAAKPPANYGFVGVAPSATILAIRQTSTVYQNQSKQTAGSALTLADAIVHAVDSGARVITTSVDICWPATDGTAQNYMRNGADYLKLQAAVQYAFEHNVVVVNSAGNTPVQPDPNQTGAQGSGATSVCQNVPQNDDPNPNQVKQIEFPAVYSNYLLSVASVNPVDVGTRTTPSPGAVSGFSEWGPWVNIAAPGEAITSIDPGQGAQGLANTIVEPSSSGSSTVQTIQGTSFAAPYVAGVAALVVAKFPTLSAAQVIKRIEYTAQHPSGADGRNNQVGFGIVDPVAALTADVPGQFGVPTVPNAQISAQLPGNAARDSAPMLVALLGTAGCLVALLITLFVVWTRRRTKGVETV
jgi:membrane-anchored mycosin MYCP